jgi:hypothetical protein
MRQLAGQSLRVSDVPDRISGLGCPIEEDVTDEIEERRNRGHVNIVVDTA